jgi:hypothetical protein
VTTVNPKIYTPIIIKKRENAIILDINMIINKLL